MSKYSDEVKLVCLNLLNSYRMLKLDIVPDINTIIENYDGLLNLDNIKSDSSFQYLERVYSIFGSLVKVMPSSGDNVKHALFAGPNVSPRAFG
jgi:hypothetical protein